MKNIKLITITLFITLLSSCRYETPIMPMVIEEINQYGNGLCKYETSKNVRKTHPFNLYMDGCVIDSCGKFNVGDTIRLTK